MNAASQSNPVVADDFNGVEPMSLASLRLIELFAFFVIVFFAGRIADLTYRADFLLVSFLATSFLQFYGNTIWGRLGKLRSWPREKVDTAVLWYSSYLDLVVVLLLIYLTGTAQSPFLFLLVVPLFFAIHLMSSRLTVTHMFLPSMVVIAVLGYLELHKSIPHFSCYEFLDDTYLNPHFYAGSLLVLGAFLSLVLFLSNCFKDRLQMSLQVLSDRNKQSGDKILELARLVDISVGVNSVISLDTLLKIVAKEATLLLAQPWSCIVLFDNKRAISHIVCVGTDQSRQALLKEKAKKDRLSEWVLANNSQVVIENVAKDRRARNSEFFACANVKSLLGHPLVAGKQVIGVLYAGDFVQKKFDARHTHLLALLSHHLTVAIEKSKLYESLENKIENYEKQIGNLERANNLKTEFCSHVSHELKTPLTSMKAYVETLLTHIDEQGFHQKKQFLEIVANETERLIRIVRDILDISRIEFGERHLSRQIFSIEKLIRDVASIMQPSLSDRNIKLVMVIPESIPNVDADQDLMKQVFINLINNAIKYSPEESVITISVEEEAVELVISVEDEGIGIPREALANIFEKHFRVRSEYSEMLEGAGLGLAIVKNIVEQHGGFITASSEEGRGSRFTFTVPKEHCFNDLAGYITEVVNAKEELQEMLELIVRMIAELLSAKIVSLMLLDKNKTELFIKVAYGLEDWIVEQTRVKVGEGIAGKVVENGQPLLINNIEQNEVYTCINNPQYETMSLLSVPLFISNQVVGVINVNNKTSGLPFDGDDMNLLISFSERMSRALERVRRREDTHAFLEDTIEAFKKMLEKQSKTKSIEGLVNLAVKLSRKLGLNEKEVRVIQYVASVHDIGMTKISDDILNKTLDLTSEEMQEIQKHPRDGTEIMRPLEFVELASNIILYHHEHIDGGGYPMGLKADEIPMGSRILAIIDAYQAMTSNKPYRKKFTNGEAIKELITYSGRQFDGEVVEAFVSVLRDEGELSPSQAKHLRKMLRVKLTATSY